MAVNERKPIKKSSNLSLLIENKGVFSIEEGIYCSCKEFIYLIDYVVRRGLSVTDLEHLCQLHTYEQELWGQDLDLIAGIDEAGRGPLAGPVVAAVVVLKEELFLPKLNDSKCVPEPLRISLAGEIKAKAAGWGIGIASVGYIEHYNILQATFYAMRQAVQRVGLQPNYVLVDGSQEVPGMAVPQTAIIKGDQKSAAIAAASILAKTTRDAIMRYYDLLYPQYDFARNKGYPTAGHLQALRSYGPCFLHRKTFRRVKEFYHQ